MEPDSYQRAWRAQSSQWRVTVDADVLLKEVRRSQESFRAMILLRDIREAGISVLMIPMWFYLGIKTGSPWTWYLTVPALMWVSGFLIADRVRHGRKPGEPGESLLIAVRESLVQVEHQIWLLRNIFWWYLLPLALSLMAFFVHTAWLSFDSGWAALGFATMLCVFVLAIFSFIYILNQYAVRKQLEPRRGELLAVLANLGDETTGGVGGEYPILMGAKGATCSRRRMFIGILILLMVLAGIMAAVTLVVDGGDQERSPFAAVRWRVIEPQVRVGEAWYVLVSLDGIPASEIVAFSRQTYGNKWQMRFEEDLVEVLTRMGHPPGETVELVVQSSTSSERQVLEGVPMTAANRRAIKASGDTHPRP